MVSLGHNELQIPLDNVNDPHNQMMFLQHYPLPKFTYIALEMIRYITTNLYTKSCIIFHTLFNEGDMLGFFLFFMFCF